MSDDFQAQEKTIDIVVAAYIIKDGKVLLINHKKLNQWLPVGGHIDANETPDDAIRREISEEIGIEIDFVDFYPETINNKKEYAKPFLVNVHKIKENHFHYALFYICTPKNELVNFNQKELNGAHWFSKHEIEGGVFNETKIMPDVQEICLEVFKLKS